MIAAFSPFLALRYLLTRRINLLGVLGVMFAVWAILLVDSVFAGFVTTIRSDVRNSTTQLLVTDLPHDTGYDAVRLALEAERDLVAATAPRLRHHGMFQPRRAPRGGERRVESSQVDFDHTENGFAILLGIDPLREPEVSGVRGWIDRAPTEFAERGIDRPRATVFDESDPHRRERLLVPDAAEWLARKRAGLPIEPHSEDHRSAWPGALLGWRRIRHAPQLNPGDPLDVVVASFPSDGKGGASLHTHSIPLAFAGWFASGHRMFDETTVLLPIETLRTLLGHDPMDDGAIDLVTDVAVRLRDEVAGSGLVAAQQRLQAAVQKVLPQGSKPCLVVDWEQQNEVFLSAVAHEQGMMQFVLFVVMLVAAFVIYATLHMMVTQKIKDIGILSALGGSPRAIGTVFLLGGVTIGTIGTLLGLGTGIVSALYLNDANDWFYATFGLELFPRRLFDLPRVPCDLSPSWIAKVGIGALLLALVVAWLPARKAARLHPVTALSHE
ncbi:MAG: ABC transporter permease [Planctomycetes bacterium]|nr:ABC transporter permease [Planctomycetota bacterium]